jgi:hypothetical protein
VKSTEVTLKSYASFESTIICLEYYLYLSNVDIFNKNKKLNALAILFKFSSVTSYGKRISHDHLVRTFDTGTIDK